MSEISSEHLSQLNIRYKTTAFVYLGQIILAVILVIGGWFYAGNIENSITPNGLMSLRVGVIFIAVITIVLRRMLFRWDSLKTITLVKGIPGLLSSLQSNAIILGTMAEIIAVIGFLITALGGFKFDSLTFGAVALILFFMNYPRRPIWEKIIANLEKI